MTVDLRNLLNECVWHVAKSMPNIPHSYTRKREWLNQDLFDQLVIYINTHGRKERFYKTVFTYYYLNDYKYWTMDKDLSKVILINRALV